MTSDTPEAARSSEPKHPAHRPHARYTARMILARLHRGRKRFEIETWAYAEETGLLIG